jgi:hypothetical protein
MAELFDVERSVVTKHIGNIYSDKELDENSVCAKFAHTTTDGKTYNSFQPIVFRIVRLVIEKAIHKSKNRYSPSPIFKSSTAAIAARFIRFVFFVPFAIEILASSNIQSLAFFHLPIEPFNQPLKMVFEDSVSFPAVNFVPFVAGIVRRTL